MKNRYIERPDGKKRCAFCQGVRNIIGNVLPKSLKGKFTDISQPIPQGSRKKK